MAKMKLLITPAAFIAMLAFSNTSVGVARGLNFAKHLAPSRGFQPRSMSRLQLPTTSSTPTRRRYHSFCTSTYSFRRAATTACFHAPDGMMTTTEISSTKGTSMDKNYDEIESTARNSLTITGSLSTPNNFGGLSYLDTSSLSTNHAHRVIFVLGGPGAGKGTQSEHIVKTYKCVHLSVGELLRSGAEKADYPHADLVKECLVQGKIVPVELSLGLLRIAMDDKVNDTTSEFGSRIFLVDGFPRNFDNVQGWIEHMPSYTSVLGALIYNCPMDVLETRIMARAETSGRTDDNLESARRRFATFQRQTEPVVRVLERIQAIQAENDSESDGGCSCGGSKLQVFNIDATGTVDDVWKATEVAMNSFVKHDVLTANYHLLKAIEHGDSETVSSLCEDTVVNDPILDGSTATTNTSAISNATLNIVNGIQAVVSYDRLITGDMRVRETREWKHGPEGWKCVSASREQI
jgi:UMP-CMP kinase